MFSFVFLANNTLTHKSLNGSLHPLPIEILCHTMECLLIALMTTIVESRNNGWNQGRSVQQINLPFKKNQTILVFPRSHSFPLLDIT
jgi:hypothetical protein